MHRYFCVYRSIMVQWWRPVLWRAVEAVITTVAAAGCSQSRQYQGSMTKAHSSCGPTGRENGWKQPATMLPSLSWSRTTEYAPSTLCPVVVGHCACVMLWLHAKYNTEIIVKLFLYFISHITAVSGYVWNKTHRWLQNYFKIIENNCFSHVTTV